jgi:hypothetical protein
MKIKCNVEQTNRWPNDQPYPHPLFEQKWMQTLKAKKMKSSTIDLNDVLWWMSIEDAYKPKALVITKL